MRHRTLLLIAAVTGLLACACGGTEAERLHRAAMREYLDPIRPGYEGRNPFWNAFATKFIYAPAFGFEPVESAVKYRFTVSHLGTSMVESPRYRKDAPTEDPEPRRVLGPGVPTGRALSFEADSPQQSLAPVWNDIPAGRVRVTAEGLDASGRVLGKAGEREFLRDFPFRPPYNGNVRPYAEAARMAALYIHELPAIRRWLTAAEPDMTYRHNTYACKIVGATIQLEVLVAKLLPAHREEALAIARNAARFLMDRSRPEGDPLAFFPPIVDDPFLYGQIAAANAISDVYAMGGEPRLALNILCLPESMTQDMVQELLRGGYDKAYEAGAIITGGHTIHGAEPIYGLAVSGFVHPRRVLTNSGAKPGDVLLLTKPLGVGVLTTAAKAGLVEEPVMQRIYRQMATLNKAARDIMVKYRVHSCTDVTGFALLGHSFEMAQGSGCTVHIRTSDVPYHPEAWELADMGFLPAGAYRNRDYAEAGVTVRGGICRTMQDLLYDPQTSGGLLMAVAEKDAEVCLRELRDAIPTAAAVGYVTEKQDSWIVLE